MKISKIIYYNDEAIAEIIGENGEVIGHSHVIHKELVKTLKKGLPAIIIFH